MIKKLTFQEAKNILNICFTDYCRDTHNFNYEWMKDVSKREDMFGQMVQCDACEADYLVLYVDGKTEDSEQVKGIYKCIEKAGFNIKDIVIWCEESYFGDMQIVIPLNN